MKLGDMFNSFIGKVASVVSGEENGELSEALSYILPGLVKDESSKEYCPNCHVPCIHKAGYWECPFCEYNIEDWEVEKGRGYSSIKAAINAVFDESDEYYRMYPHRNQYCPECHILCVREGDVFKCPTCDYYICDSDIEDGDGYSTLASTYEDEEDNYPLPDDYEPEEDIPECCIACGGPYPQCTTSCKIFDD